MSGSGATSDSDEGTERSSKDLMVDEVVAKVEQRPAIDAPHDEVRSRTGEAVDGLIDRPVQSFTPLLAENEVVGDLLAEQHDRQTGEQDETDPITTDYLRDLALINETIHTS